MKFGPVFEERTLDLPAMIFRKPLPPSGTPRIREMMAKRATANMPEMLQRRDSKMFNIYFDNHG